MNNHNPITINVNLGKDNLEWVKSFGEAFNQNLNDIIRATHLVVTSDPKYTAPRPEEDDDDIPEITDFSTALPKGGRVPINLNIEIDQDNLEWLQSVGSYEVLNSILRYTHYVLMKDPNYKLDLRSKHDDLIN